MSVIWFERKELLCHHRPHSQSWLHTPILLVIAPRSLPHKQTFILLHGRGSSGEKFGPALLETPIPLPSSDSTATKSTTNVLTLASAFPHARFVFPTAARRRATVYGRAHTRQWFDNWKLDPPATDREELQVPGLGETTAYLHGLLRAEIAAVPGGRAADVVLGGLSQGCAAALVLWEGEEPLGVFVGMCGWLPFAARLDEQLVLAGSDQDAVKNRGEEEEDVDDDMFDPFERDDPAEEAELDPPTRAVNWLKEEIQIFSAVPSSSTRRGPGATPVFLGHGVEDDRVSVVLGRHASACLSKMGTDASWREYEGLGHWYSGDMLRDMVEFVHAKTKWELPM
jgi:predicted esterase